MGQELSQKVAVVTGGASGIGRSTAELFVAEGAKVVIADIDVDQGEKVAEALGPGAAFKRTDVSRVDDLQALVDFAVDRFGGLHVLFNNAGISSSMTRFLRDDFGDFAHVMNVNLLAALVGSQRAALHMKANGGGSIINNASIAGISAGPGLITYRASKAALIHATRSMAIDLAPYGIRVNCVAPAHILSPITTYDMELVMRFTQPLGRQGRPEDVANAVVYLASDRSAQVTGVVLPVDGGTTAGPPAHQLKALRDSVTEPTAT